MVPNQSYAAGGAVDDAEWNSPPVPKRRLGVALLVPPPFDAAVETLRTALGDPALGRIPPHLTLVPPVNVRDDRMDDALAVLRAAGEAMDGPLVLELGPVATFLPTTPVAYLAVGGDLAGLEQLREAIFVEPLARSLTWPFVPHVTLADEAPTERIEAAVAALADYRVAVVFEHVHVLEEGSGRVWTPVADARLGPPPARGGGGVAVELHVSAAPPPDAAGLLGPQLTVTARRDGRVVGVLVARDGTVETLRLEPGHEDVEVHLRRALTQHQR
jgi:2'-5' RNA ligase